MAIATFFRLVLPSVLILIHRGRHTHWIHSQVFNASAVACIDYRAKTENCNEDRALILFVSQANLEWSDDFDHPSPLLDPYACVDDGG